MDELLEAIQAIQASTSATGLNGVAMDTGTEEGGVSSWRNSAAGGFGDDADAVYDEEVYDDTGEGVGVEGDLDAEED